MTLPGHPTAVKRGAADVVLTVVVTSAKSGRVLTARDLRT
jgi:hypothetical protein